jgi:2-(1,2-epoxy-1,2-dihydrophenyl)acetyl-CoA isomerase
VQDFGRFGDVRVRLGDDHVATAEIRRPPNNFFDTALITSLADAFEKLDASPCRAIVLCADGKHFCAGANFGGGGGGRGASGGEQSGPRDDAGDLYREAVRLFAAKTPVVAAVQGAAVGGGLGLALVADFRVASPEARFSANFAKLGFHHGFGLTVTLPRLVGMQVAQDLLYTGRRVPGQEALHLGLCDRLSPHELLREDACLFAREIAESAPLAVRSIRETLRGELAEQVRVATERERSEQARLQQTRDFREGIAATAERRAPKFEGR